jgi:hypothetical protein
MRTKTLLLTAALCAAGAATSMAQVYSVNMVGYINQSIPAGFSMIANQLNNSPNNTVAALFPAPADGTKIYKFNATTGGFIIMEFADGEWSAEATTQRLDPGDGAYIFAPAAFTHTFVGEVQLTSTVNLPRGFSMVGSALPQSAPLTGTPPAGLDYPIGDGDKIYRFNPATGGFIINEFADGEWSLGAPPTVNVGEAFYAFNNGAAAKGWSRTFTVGP